MRAKKEIKSQFELLKPEISSLSELPLCTTTISAGFPSPADDYIDHKLDLNEYLVRNEPSTFLLRVSGNSMVNAGIHHGDILVVDRSVEPIDGKIIIGIIDGEFTVKRILKKGKKIFLQPENEDFALIEVTEEMEFKIWGVVTFAIHKL